MNKHRLVTAPALVPVLVSNSTIQSVEKYTFHHISWSAPQSGAAVICFMPGVISFICTRPATEICSSVLRRPYLLIQLQHEHHKNKAVDFVCSRSKAKSFSKDHYGVK